MRLVPPTPTIVGDRTATRTGALVRIPTGWMPAGLLVVAGAASFIAILRRVVGGSRFQSFDYWAILNRSVSLDGSFEWDTLLLLQNEHPVAFARLLYFVNARLFAGSNLSLGAIVIGLAVMQLALILSAVLPGRGRRALVILPFAVAVLFSPAGLHNFQLSMSGAAWLSANLFAIAAFRLMLSGRAELATVAGLAASASYGTGLMVWPALAVMAALSGPEPAGRRLPIAVGWVVSWVTYLALYDRPAGHGGFGFDLAGIGFRSLSVLGSSLSSDPATAALLGATGIGLFAWLYTESGGPELVRSRFGIGVATYAIGAATLIGFSRSEFGVSVGVSSRYVSISAIFLIGLFLVALDRSPRWMPVAAVVALAAAVGGQGSIPTYDRFEAEADEASIAVLVGSGTGYFPTFDAVALPTMRAIDHHPFDGSFELACGLLGERIDVPPISDVGITGEVQLAGRQRDPSLVRGEGTLREVSTGARCVLAVTADGDVVGAGALGFPLAAGEQREGSVGFSVLGPVESAELLVVVVGEDDQLYRLDGALEQTREE